MDSKDKLCESLGFLIKEKRKLKGLTQSRLAQLCGISISHVGKLEDGAYVPKLSTYLKLAEILKFDIEDIKTNQKYTPRKLEAEILKVLRKYNESDLKLCLDIIISIEKNRKK